MIGGLVVKAVEAAPPVDWPLIGELKPWQTVLVMVGLPGLLLAAAMLLIREPVRRGVAATGGEKLAPLLPFLAANRSTVIGLFLGFTLLGIVVIAYLSWMPAVFMRSFGWHASEIGLAFGLIVMTCGSLGIIAGGLLADRLTKKGHVDAAVRAGLYGGLATIPLAAVAPLLPSPGLILAASGLALLAATSTQALPIVAIQFMTPNNLRARMAAVYFLVGSLLLYTGGPTSVALLTDYLFRDDAAVRYSLALVSLVVAPLGVLLLWWVLPHYRRSLVAAASWE
jgi:MFS family permease